MSSEDWSEDLPQRIAKRRLRSAWGLEVVMQNAFGTLFGKRVSTGD